MSVPDYRDHYRLRLLTSLAGTLVVCISVVRLWPADLDRSPQMSPTTEEEVIHLETVAPTRQKTTPPPPPRAAVAPPMAVPEEMLPAEDPLDLDISWRTGPSDGTISGPPGDGRDSAAIRFSDEAPQPVHFAEPAYPRAAWQQGIRAQIVVKVTVDETGRAKTHRITDRYLIKRNRPNRSVSAACCSKQIMQRELVKTSNRSRVSQLGHGLEEAALGAAWKWRFEPPTEGGEALASSAVLTFTFGR